MYLAQAAVDMGTRTQDKQHYGFGRSGEERKKRRDRRYRNDALVIVVFVIIFYFSTISCLFFFRRRSHLQIFLFGFEQQKGRKEEGRTEDGTHTHTHSSEASFLLICFLLLSPEFLIPSLLHPNQNKESPWCCSLGRQNDLNPSATTYSTPDALCDVSACWVTPS